MTRASAPPTAASSSAPRRPELWHPASRAEVDPASALVQQFSISLDGFGTGEPQSLDAPFGHAGERLHEWMFATRWWGELVGQPGGSGGIDEAFLRLHDSGGPERARLPPHGPRASAGGQTAPDVRFSSNWYSHRSWPLPFVVSAGGVRARRRPRVSTSVQRRRLPTRGARVRPFGLDELGNASPQRRGSSRPPLAGRVHVAWSGASSRRAGQ